MKAAAERHAYSQPLKFNETLLACVGVPKPATVRTNLVSGLSKS